MVPKGVQRRHLTGLSEVTWCPQGPAQAGSQGYALYSPGGGAIVLGELQCLGGGKAKGLRVLGRMGRRSKAQDGHCWERTRTRPPAVKPKVPPSPLCAPLASATSFVELTTPCPDFLSGAVPTFFLELPKDSI